MSVYKMECVKPAGKDNLSHKTRTTVMNIGYWFSMMGL